MHGHARPLVIAHRGASADAPENTIAAFELALEQGADGIELDVHLSADGHPVVIHDFSLERTTNGSGPVNSQRVRDLKRLDAGGWRERRFVGQRIQTLQEVLERFRDRARFWVELKAGSRIYPGIEERVVSTLEIYDVVGRALIQSFDQDAVALTRALNPEVRVGVLVEEGPVQQALLTSGIANAICPGEDLVNESLLTRIREAGLECYVWTVNQPALMDQLVSWHVSGIITDRPGVLSARLGR